MDHARRPDANQGEAELLAAVEREAAGVGPRLATMVPIDRQASLAELQAAVAYTRQVEQWYMNLVGPATLRSYDRLMQRLSEVVAEIRRSRSTCEQMLLDRVAAQQAAFANQPPPPPPPNPAAAQKAASAARQAAYEAARKQQQADFDAGQEAHRQRQEAFDAQNKAWAERFKKH